jgi:hypothetical protein
VIGGSGERGPRQMYYYPLECLQLVEYRDEKEEQLKQKEANL